MNIDESKDESGMDLYLKCARDGALDYLKKLEKHPYYWDVTTKDYENNDAYYHATVGGHVSIWKHFRKKHKKNIFGRIYKNNRMIIKCEYFYLALIHKRTKLLEYFYEEFKKQSKYKNCIFHIYFKSNDPVDCVIRYATKISPYQQAAYSPDAIKLMVDIDNDNSNNWEKVPLRNKINCFYWMDHITSTNICLNSTSQISYNNLFEYALFKGYFETVKYFLKNFVSICVLPSISNIYIFTVNYYDRFINYLIKTKDPFAIMIFLKESLLQNLINNEKYCILFKSLVNNLNFLNDGFKIMIKKLFFHETLTKKKFEKGFEMYHELIDTKEDQAFLFYHFFKRGPEWKETSDLIRKTYDIDDQEIIYAKFANYVICNNLLQIHEMIKIYPNIHKAFKLGKNEDNCLFYAARNNHFESLMFWENIGYDLKQKNSLGQTCYDITTSNEIKSYLKYKVTDVFPEDVYRNLSDPCLICKSEYEKSDPVCKCENGHIVHKDCYIDYLIQTDIYDESTYKCVLCKGKMNRTSTKYSILKAIESVS